MYTVGETTQHINKLITQSTPRRLVSTQKPTDKFRLSDRNKLHNHREDVHKLQYTRQNYYYYF